MAVWTRQQTGSRARPASREALRRAAVKPRPSSMSPYAPARTARSPGSRGTAPCASHEAHRRMAVWTRQQTGSRARPASREALRRAAVKPRPSSMSPYAPARTARSPGSRGTAPCASHEAHRRMAVWARQQTGSRARPASREALRRAAVKPRPSSMSPYAPARTARSPGSRGTAPCASHEAHRRMAVFAMQLAGICTRPASRGTCRATVVKPQPTCMSLYAPARPWRAVRG